jgi:hypothetical protein
MSREVTPEELAWYKSIRWVGEAEEPAAQRPKGQLSPIVTSPTAAF